MRDSVCVCVCVCVREREVFKHATGFLFIIKHNYISFFVETSIPEMSSRSLIEPRREQKSIWIQKNLPPVRNALLRGRGRFMCDPVIKGRVHPNHQNTENWERKSVEITFWFLILHFTVQTVPYPKCKWCLSLFLFLSLSPSCSSLQIWISNLKTTFYILNKWYLHETRHKQKPDGRFRGKTDRRFVKAHEPIRDVHIVLCALKSDLT